MVMPRQVFAFRYSLGTCSVHKHGSGGTSNGVRSDITCHFRVIWDDTSQRMNDINGCDK